MVLTKEELEWNERVQEAGRNAAANAKAKTKDDEDRKVIDNAFKALPKLEQDRIKKEEDEARKKRKEDEDKKKADDDQKAKDAKLDAAATKFAEYQRKFGGSHEATKAFFDLVGPDALKKEDPAEEKKDEKKGDEKKKDDARARDAIKALPSTEIADRSKYELGLPTRPPGYGATYLGENWAMKTISGVDNPVSIKAAGWQVVMESNKIFHGYVIRPNGSLTRARWPVFQLKQMYTGTDTPPKQADSPDFEVYDASNISVVETSSEFEKSSVTNGFSATAWSAQGSISAFGASLSGGYSRNTEKTTNSSEGTFRATKEYTAIYTFPRARVFVDQLDLQLTSKAKDALSAIVEAYKKVKANVDTNKDANNEQALEKAVFLKDEFFARFGHIFATTFQLGGQLNASKSADSFGTTSDSQARDAMKQSAAVSLDTKWVAFEGKWSNESNTSEQKKENKVNNVSALAWSARGGNTLLAANPPEWANSLSGFSTWRTIQQEEVFAIPDLIQKFTLVPNETPAASAYSFNFLDIQPAFQLINKQSFKLAPKPTPGKWTGKIRLVTNEGKRIVKGADNVIKMDASAHPANEVEFTVLDGDIDNVAAEPTLGSLLAEYPLFLVTESTYNRSAKLGSQVPGLFVDNEGYLKGEGDASRSICRWSLRIKTVASDHEHRWYSGGKRTVDDGEEVRLHCHSLRTGVFRSVKTTQNSLAAPYWAPTVWRKAGDDRLRVESLDYSKFNEFTMLAPYLLNDPKCGFKTQNSAYMQSWITLYDEGKLSYDQIRELGVFNNLWAWKNDNEVKSTFSGFPWSSSQSVGMFGQKPDATLKQFHEGVAAQWKSSTQFNNEVTFRVEYVYT